MYDVVALGELLIDFTPAGLVFSDEVNTTLAFVHLDEQGDCSFSFYRKPGADMMLTEEEVNLELINNTQILHFGSLSMTNEPVKSAALKAVQYAKEKGVIVSYDPNLRPALWENLEQAKEVMLEGMNYADVLKISEEELLFLTGTEDLLKGSQSLAEQYNIKLIFVTLGPNGCFYRIGTHTGHIPGYKVKAVDTTGAGDGFFGGILYQIIQRNKNLTEYEVKDIEDSIRFANAVGALAATKRGAIDVMPTLEEIESLIK